MFDILENNKDDNFFNKCDIEMEEIDNLYEECEKLYYENEINKQKDKDIYTFYMMFNVVIYMLIIGSNIKQCLKNYYIETLFPKKKITFKEDNVNMLD